MVYVDDRDGVRRLRMHAGKVQALDLELTERLTRAFDEAGAAGAPPLVLTGTGASFSAGVDLFRIVRDGAPYIDRFLPALATLLRTVFEYPGPLVTAINGHAIAGGALLAWCGDVRVMAAGRGRIGVPELRVGVPFPAAAVEILRFATGGRGLQTLAYIGRTLTPDDALAAGLLDEVVAAEELDSRTETLAASLAAIPRNSFRITKQALRMPYLEVLRRHEASFDAEVVRVWHHPDTRAAIEAYLERTFGHRT